MSKIKIAFNKLIQDSQEYGSDNQYMVSRAFFSIQVEGKPSFDSFVNIKQTVGSDFETAPLEVSKPEGYTGVFDFQSFSDETESYYRGLVGSQGSGIQITGGSNIRMEHNTFMKQKEIELHVSDESPSW